MNYGRSRKRNEEDKAKETLQMIMAGLLLAFFFFCALVISGYRYSDDPELNGFVYHKEIPMDRELQEHLWKQCRMWDVDYGLALGSIELESHFTPDITSKVNDNGTVDIGICQINSGNIEKLKRLGLIQKREDLLDPYKNIECGMFILGMCVEEFGNTEQAYYYYNTGKKRFGSNEASRIVWRNTQEWHKILDFQ